MKRKIVIVGAGSSGRGLIARLCQADGADICFVDKDERLIRKLNAKGRFSVLVGEGQEESLISGYQAFQVDSEEALAVAEQADYIFVCVGKLNLAGLKSFFDGLGRRKPADQCRIVVCENGISPKSTLRGALRGTEGEGMKITQGVIFCTCIPKEKGDLDIISEDYDQLPIDYDEGLFRWESPHFPFINNFDRLMERKLYTYNCLSACIAYLGYLKGYDDYGAAARDHDILRFCNRMRRDVDEAVCRLTGVSKEEQREFSRRAMEKFSSPVIVDTIEKNARDAIRKIGPDERLMGPARLFEDYQMDVAPLGRVIAAALCYMEREEGLKLEGKIYEDPISLLLKVNPGLEPEAGLVKSVKEYLRQIREGVEAKQFITDGLDQ